MTPSVLIAVARGPEAEREPLLHHVLGHLSWLEWPIVVAGGGYKTVDRNRAARTIDSEVILFQDADTLVPHEQIRAACEHAATTDRIVFAFTRYQRLDATSTVEVLCGADPFTMRPVEEFTSPPSHGCLAMSRTTFDRLGGYDERLEGWEDVAMNVKANGGARITGPAVHLYHPGMGAEWTDRFAESRRIVREEYGVPV